MTHQEIRERNAKLFADVKAGRTDRESLAKKYGFSSARSLCNLLTRENIRLPRLEDAVTVGYRVIALLQAGTPQVDAARQLGVSRQRVSQIAKAARAAGIKF